MAETIVKIENLVKRYHELVAVDHFNLTVSKGEILGLLGPNGSGKTTTMNCLLSLLAYDKGSIEVFGKPMKPDSYDLKRNIGVVFQNVAVFDTLTVQENIDYFCGLYIKDKKLRRQYVAEAVEFAGLSDFVKFYPKKTLRRTAPPFKHRLRHCAQAEADSAGRTDRCRRPTEP